MWLSKSRTWVPALLLLTIPSASSFTALPVARLAPALPRDVASTLSTQRQVLPALKFTRLPLRSRSPLAVSMIDPAFVNLGVGALSGGIATALVFPVETAKTKMQMGQDGSNCTANSHLGIAGALQGVVKTDGIAGVYKGLAPVLIGSAPECAIQMTIYEKALSLLQGYEQISGNAAPLPAMLAGTAAGLCQVVATNPLEVLKMKAMSNSTTGLVGDIRQLGLKGLFHGCRATMFRDIPFAAIYFPAFSMSRGACESAIVGGLTASLLAGVGSGLVAALITTPADVIKTHIQMRTPVQAPPKTDLNPQELCVRSVGQRIVQEKGWKALFLGVEARVARQAPQMAISQSLFHQLQQLILRPSFKPMGTVVMAQTTPLVVETAQSEVVAISPQLEQCAASAAASEAIAAEMAAVESAVNSLCATAANLAEVAVQQAVPGVAVATEVAQQATAALPLVQQAATVMP